MAEDVAVTEARIHRDAIGSLYREQGAKLWRAVMAFAHDRAVTDEAVAEAFAQLLHRGDAVRDPVAWVWTAAFRIAAGELARNARDRRRSIVEATSYSQPDPIPELTAALAGLPPVQRAVVVLHDYADRPTAEIAETLGIAKSTVRVHLSHARRKLRTALEGQR